MGEPQRAIIFDLDGVLVDSFRAHLENWRRLADERGCRYSEEDFAASFGRASRDTIDEHWARHLDDDVLDDVEARKDELFREVIEEDFPVIGGAVALVEALDEAGFALAVVSSAPPENVALCLDRLGCADRFSVTITSHDVEVGVPNPEIFLLAAERLCVELSHCAVIENAKPGVKAGKAAGMLVVGLAGFGRSACQLAGAEVVGTSIRQLTPENLAELIDRRSS